MEYRREIGRQWLCGSALLCLVLGACNKNPQTTQATQPATGAPIAALQLATAPPPPPTYAPPASALPPAPRRVAYRPSREHWRYLTDAYDMSDAFADTPPDYTVPYDGEDPYVWRADDGAYRVVEWMPQGARYYYYEPGVDEPFLIQDPEYSYAYDNGALVAVYTLAGALVADRIAAEREAYAARYYARGRDLYRAAVNDRRRAAYAANWQQRAPMIQAQRTRWQRGRDDQPEWSNWYQEHQPQQDARWAAERQRRATYAAALGAAGVAGAAYAVHHRDQQAAQRAAETRPAPPPPAGMDRRPALLPNANHPNSAERRAEAGRAQPGPMSGPLTPAPGAHDRQGVRPWPHGPDLRQAGTQPPAPPNAQPRPHDARNPQQMIAARQALARAEQAQQQATQQAQQAQKHELQQAQQAQRAEARAQRQAAQTQHADMQARMRQAPQAQKHELQQAQQAQRAEAQAQRQAAQTQHADMQARMRQAQQAQRHDLQQAQQAERAAARLQAQAQTQRAQARAEAHVAPPHVETPHAQPPHVEAPRPTPVAHAAAPHPPAPRPAPQPHTNDHGGSQKDDRRHH